MPDLWTAWQFDECVLTFGKYLDSQLEEYDPQTGRRVHNLRELLDIPLSPREKREMNRKSHAMMEMLANDRRSGVVIG